MSTEEAHVRYVRWWDAFFVGVTVIIGSAVFFGSDDARWRRLVTAGALGAMIVLHLTVGRRLVRRGAEDYAAMAVLLVQLTLFTLTVAVAPFTTWLLFAVIPLIFQLASIRPAIALVVVATLITPAVDLFRSPENFVMDLIIALISAVAGIWLGFWIIRVIEQSVERGELIAELEASRAEVSRLSHEAGVLAERARLAGEIHDTLAQGFTSIITLLQAADPALRDERLALAVRTAKENLAESRALVAALAPAALTQGALPDSVRRQATRFTEETGTPATVRVTGDERALPTAVEVVLLRAAQEALTNVRRHAAAQETAILLAYAPESVRLVVRDDGRGFDPAAADGFGLNGMRARADQVRGALTVHSDPDTGTTIELEVPA
ncbi:sensor histidine kinase [Paractinoplanes durhamensis]|uniref:sensor histidine kinase n=1 Tax=Paractinoplanes durhamensis TaxID=113563 RepID=UPI001EF24F16|nr:sensor histidine kinase [Actinoplanes durhamensis]